MSTEFLTVSEIAAELGLCTKTIGKYLNEGQLPGVRFGHVWRIPVVQWNAYKAGTWQPQPSSNVTAADFTPRRRSA